MDITSAASAAAGAAVTGTEQSGIGNSLIRSAENLAATQAAILMQSLGLGNNVDFYA